MLNASKSRNAKFEKSSRGGYRECALLGFFWWLRLWWGFFEQSPTGEVLARWDLCFLISWISYCSPPPHSKQKSKLKARVFFCKIPSNLETGLSCKLGGSGVLSEKHPLKNGWDYTEWGTPSELSIFTLNPLSLWSCHYKVSSCWIGVWGERAKKEQLHNEVWHCWTKGVL